MASYSVGTLDKAKFEGTGTGATFTFTITRSGDLGAAGSVAWKIINGKPAPMTPDDFVDGTALTGTTLFDAGVASIDIIVKLNGDTDPEPNEGFGIQLVGASGGDDFSYVPAFAIVNDDDAQHILGTAKNDTLNNSKFTKGTVTDVSQGGNDTVTGGIYNDTVVYGATFTANDRFDGGEGTDRIVLSGDYSKGVTLARNTLVRVEEIDFTDGYNYKLTTTDPNVAPGETLVFNARSLSPINSVTINGSAETSGHLYFIGGSGGDTFKGGRDTDAFIGGYGADKMDGFNGADTFIYEEALDSPLVTDGYGNILPSFADQISNFQAAFDQIDLTAFGLIGGQTAVLARTNTSFTTNLSAGGDFFGPPGAAAGIAVEYAKVKNVMTARVYVDVDHDGNLGTSDMMVQVTGVARGGLQATSFIV